MNDSDSESDYNDDSDSSGASTPRHCDSRSESGAVARATARGPAAAARGTGSGAVKCMSEGCSIDGNAPVGGFERFRWYTTTNPVPTYPQSTAPFPLDWEKVLKIR